MVESWPLVTFHFNILLNLILGAHSHIMRGWVILVVKKFKRGSGRGIYLPTQTLFECLSLESIADLVPSSLGITPQKSNFSHPVYLGYITRDMMNLAQD